MNTSHTDVAEALAFVIIATVRAVMPQAERRVAFETITNHLYDTAARVTGGSKPILSSLANGLLNAEV